MFGKRNIPKMIFRFSPAAPPLNSGACNPIQNTVEVKKKGIKMGIQVIVRVPHA